MQYLFIKSSGDVENVDQEPTAIEVENADGVYLSFEYNARRKLIDVRRAITTEVDPENEGDEPEVELDWELIS